MKRIINILGLLSLLLFFNACVNEEDDLFDSSAAVRMDEALKTYKEILITPENGWLMEYYPSATRAYGGYTVLVSFQENGKTVVSSELTGFNNKQTSYYSLKSDSGPVISFDTYNEVMHYFSNPENPDNIGGLGVGMEGDYEFVIMEISPESITLKGKKTGNHIVMTPFAVGQDWSTYLQSILDAAYKMTSFAYEYTIGGEKLNVIEDYRVMTFQFTNEDNEAILQEVPYIQTPTGVKFYEPFTIKGKEINSLEYVDTTEPYLTSDGDDKLVRIQRPLNEIFASGTWFFNYHEMGAYGQSQWNSVKTKLDALDEELGYVCMSPYRDISNMYLDFAVRSENKIEYGFYIYDIRLINEDRIYLYSTGRCDEVGYEYYNKISFNNILNALTSTFTITTTDNIYKPKKLFLQDISRPTNTYTVVSDALYYPFEN